MRAVLHALVLASSLVACTPDPFGTDCRYDTACQEREAKKKGAAEAAKRRECEARGWAWIDDAQRLAQTVPAGLSCDLARSACDGTDGCPGRSSCWEVMEGESPYCVDEGSQYDGHCVTCADRADMVADKARFAAEYHVQRVDEERRIADAELASGQCDPRSVSSAEGLLGNLDRETGSLPLVDKGTVVATAAGVPFTIHLPKVDRRHELLIVSAHAVTLRGPGRAPVIGEVSDADRYLVQARVTLTPRAGEPTAPTWTAVGDGCVIWRLHGAE